MRNEHRWTTEIGGVVHTIICQTEGNRYILWADDDCIKTFYQQLLQTARGGIDKKFELFGYPCHFVVWESQVPDLFLNGESLTDKRGYQDAVIQHNRIIKILLSFIFVVSMLVCASFAVSTARGANTTQWTGAFVISLVYLIVSLARLIVHGK